MSEQWSAVDEFINASVVHADEALEKALASTAEAGMPAIAVSAAQGKMLHLMARMIGARRILEVGTLGGYSTIWLARALPSSGKLISLELDQRHAEVARTNVTYAGLSELVEVRVGPALETLPKLDAEARGDFDLTFIDADKANIPEYFEWAVKLSHSGGVIVVDNVVRNGALIDADSTDPNVIGVRRMYDLITAMANQVTATTIQTVGSKGYDGFTLARIH